MDNEPVLDGGYGSESSEWMESLDAVIAEEGAERAELKRVTDPMG